MAQIILLDSFEGWNNTDPLIKWDAIANYDNIEIGAQNGRNGGGALIRSGGTSTFDPLGATIAAGNQSAMLEKYFPVSTSLDVGLAIKLSDIELEDYLPIISFLDTTAILGFIGQYFGSRVQLLLTPQQQLVFIEGDFFTSPIVFLSEYSPPLKRGVFSYIEARIQINSNGLLRLRMDGKVVIDQQADTVGSSGSSFINGVRLFHHKSRVSGARNARVFYIDDVFIATDGPVQFRDGLIEAAFPGANGEERDWIPSNGGTFNYDMVDDAQPDEDTTYNYSTTAGAIDTYDFPPQSTPGSIHALTLNIDVVNKVFDEATLSAIVRRDGVNYPSSPQRVGTIMPENPKGYLYNVYGFENSPATGVQFSADEITNGEFGMQLVTVGGGGSGDGSGETPVDPPNPPSNLVATTVSATQVNITFQDNSNDEAGFRLEVATAIDGPYSQIAEIGSSPYPVTQLPSGTTFFFRLRAFSGGGNSAYSNIASATTLSGPSAPSPAPSNLVAQAVSPTQINIGWQNNSNNEDGTRIEISTSEFTGFAQIASVLTPQVTYPATGLLPETTYYFRVRDYNVGGHSSYSNTTSATTQAAPLAAPTAPSNLTATAVSSTQINLAWTDNSNNETGFKVERSLSEFSGFVQIGTVGANLTTFPSINLTPNTQYFHRVRATNATGDSAYSNTASDTTQGTTPTGDADFYVSLLGSDGNPGTLTQPFRTIGKGISMLTAGKKLAIRGGVYTERLSNTSFTFPSGTSYTNAVTISAYPGESVTVRPSGNGSYVLQLLYQGTVFRYIIFENITFDANSKANTHCVSLDGVNYAGFPYTTNFGNIHHIRFRRCIFTGSNLSGVLTGRGANYLEFLNCRAHHCGTDDQFDHGMYLQSSYCLIEGGEYDHNPSSGVQIYTGLDRGAGSNSDRANFNVVRKARFHDNEHGLILGSGDTNAAYNNHFYDNILEGVKTGFTGGIRTKIIGNTSYNNGNNGIEIREGIDDVVCKNNISYLNGNNTTNNLLDLGDGTIKTNNLLGTNPSFVNAGAADFHLNAGSAALNAGATVSEYTDDFDGVSRPQGTNYDIGAYERVG